MARSYDDQAATADLIAEGRAALIAGEKPRAQALLQAAVRKAPDNVDAWLWLSGSHDAPEDIAYCLRKVLLLDPANEQAREGLAWLSQTHGVAVPATVLPAPPMPQRRPTPLDDAGLPARTVDDRQADRRRQAEEAQRAALAAREAASAERMVETALYVGGVGALIGILRLLGALRPQTLLVIRGSAGPLDTTGAFVLALGTALAHAAALIVAWLIFAFALGRARNDRAASPADTLARAGSILAPGYMLAACVAIAGIALGWSEQRWLPMVGLIWATMILGVAVMGRRLLQVFDALRIPSYRRTNHVIRLVGPAAVVAVAGIVIAGLAMRALLRAL